ncbi:MAG: hypothetical protein LIP05_15665 [Tannerellaceae bacterium]|nr:hypothetical protein [Tannerellaceae bacterium]
MKEVSPIEEYIIRYLQGNICDKELHELMDWIRSSEENKTLFFEIKRIHDSSTKNREILLPDPAKSWERMFTRIQPELTQKTLFFFPEDLATDHSICSDLECRNGEWMVCGNAIQFPFTGKRGKPPGLYGDPRRKGRQSE